MPSGAGGSAPGWPVGAFYYGIGYESIALGGANNVYVAGIVIPYALTFSHIEIWVQTSDASNHYDFGLYTQAGALIANLGPTVFGATGLISTPTLQGTRTINPGLYVFGFTGDANVLAVARDHTTPTWATNANIATSSGGTLPASIGAVGIAPDVNALWVVLY